MSITMGEITKAINCHPATIRRYEKKGIISSTRNYRNYRLFDESVIQVVLDYRERLRSEFNR